MTNKEYVALLKQGVEVWNLWRERNPLLLPKLIGADLSGAYLIGVNLRKCSLAGADLTRQIFVAWTLSKQSSDERYVTYFFLPHGVHLVVRRFSEEAPQRAGQGNYCGLVGVGTGGLIVAGGTIHVLS
jgi:hypothetical protein